MNIPFEIGKTYWLPRLVSTNIRETCPVCYGKKEVVVILGNDEQVTVECDGCGLGYSGPRGYVDSYTYEAHAEAFTIVQINSMCRDSWYVENGHGIQTEWSTLHDTPETAMEQSRKTMQEVIDQNMISRMGTRARKSKDRTWMVAYHEKCIKDFVRQIEWHRAKVSERKAKAS